MKNNRKWWKTATTCCQITMGHNLLLIEKIKNKDTRRIYAENIIKNGWNRNTLAIQIETEFYILKIGMI